jgi:hypothetical protein
MPILERIHQAYRSYNNVDPAAAENIKNGEHHIYTAECPRH